MPDLLGHHDDLYEVAGNVLEKRKQVDFLLIGGTQRHAALLADYRHHRLVIHLGVIKPVQKMDRSRPRRCQTDTGDVLIGELGETAGHERGHFLVTRLNEVESVSGPVQGSEDAIDAIT